ncbi:MAG: GxxExxY protein [Phycisphaerae bacterium]|nr:GxxExxY protein [Phycisphaerae bacterium]
MKTWRNSLSSKAINDINSGLTEGIIGAAFDVANELGCGFLEKVYENAMLVSLRSRGLAVVQQQRFDVQFRYQLVGEYVADLVVEGSVLVELKAVRKLDDVHTAQCLNLLRASGLPLCLLMNFARPSLEIRRLAR